MTTLSQSLVARAEIGLARLRQAREAQQDQEVRRRMRIISDRAVAARSALEAVRDVVPALGQHGVRPGPLTGNLLTDAKKARTDLRQAATAALRQDGVRRLDRLVGPSVHDALNTSELLAKQRLNDLNRAVDAWRKLNLPLDVEEEVTDLPGTGTLRVRLQRLAALLNRPISGVPAQELPKKIDELRSMLTEWRKSKDEYDAVLKREDPEIRAFLAHAATEVGAGWSMVTPAVRRWLDDANDADVVRIRLT